jgi:hypothetical protein
VRTLAIGGFGSGSGKTTLVERALARLPGWGALKTSPGRHGRTPSGAWSLETDAGRLCVPGSDTARMTGAGADRVAWLRTEGTPPAEALAAVRAWSRGLPGLVVEGLRAAEALGAERLYLVARGGAGELKPAAIEAAARAAAIVVNGETDPPGLPAGRIVRVDLARPGDPGLEELLVEISDWSRR